MFHKSINYVWILLIVFLKIRVYNAQAVNNTSSNKEPTTSVNTKFSDFGGGYPNMLEPGSGLVGNSPNNYPRNPLLYGNQNNNMQEPQQGYGWNPQCPSQGYFSEKPYQPPGSYPGNQVNGMYPLGPNTFGPNFNSGFNPNYQIPNVNRPNVNRPNVKRPNVNGPNVNRPNANRPNVNAPNVNRPNVNGPNVNIPNVNGPNVNRPNVNGPNVNRPNINGPNVNRPNVNGPNVNRPNANRPNVNGPNVNRPNVNGPNINRPNVNGPNANRPNINRPNVNRPNVNGPNVNRPNANTPGNGYPGYINRPYQNGRLPNQGGFPNLPDDTRYFPQGGQYPSQGNFQGNPNLPAGGVASNLRPNYPDNLNNIPDTNVQFPGSDIQNPNQANQYPRENGLGNQGNVEIRPNQNNNNNYPSYSSNNMPGNNMQHSPNSNENNDGLIRFPNKDSMNQMSGNNNPPGAINLRCNMNGTPQSQLPNNQQFSPVNGPNAKDTGAILGTPVFAPSVTSSPGQPTYGCQ